MEEIFLEGTEPTTLCSICKFEENRNRRLVNRLRNSVLAESISLDDFEMPDIEDNYIDDIELNIELERMSGSSGTDSEVTNPLLD